MIPFFQSAPNWGTVDNEGLWWLYTYLCYDEVKIYLIAWQYFYNIEKVKQNVQFHGP